MATPLIPTWPGAEYAAHQVAGINWMLNQEKVGIDCSGTLVHGGILGDEMGLGKTIQSLALIVNNPVKRTLILGPLPVRKQWQEAAARCDVNLYIAESAEWKAQGKIRPKRPNVFIGHYDRLNSNKALFSDMKFNRIILDEAHRVRNPRTSSAKNVLGIIEAAEFRWVLTGTPIVNELADAVVYLRFIGCPVEEGKRTWQPQYKEWVKKVYLARLMSEVEAPAGLCLPPEPDVDIRDLDFTNDDEEKIYNAIYRNLESQMRNAQALRGRAYNLLILQILLRLRQVSITPQIYIEARRKEEWGYMGPDFAIPSRKFKEIEGLLSQSQSAGESNRWIIFCQFKAEIDLLRKFLRGMDCVGNILEYHGSMSLKERDEAIAASKIATPGKQDVFLIQIHSGGTGLNLQHYNRVIFTSNWWTAALMDQAIGRAVRIGQKEKVKVYLLRLSAESTFNIDSFIIEKADRKRMLASQFLSWSIGPDGTQREAAAVDDDDEDYDDGESTAASEPGDMDEEESPAPRPLPGSAHPLVHNHRQHLQALAAIAQPYVDLVGGADEDPQ